MPVIVAPDATVAATIVGQSGGESHAVAIDGSFAYLGVGPRLHVLDVSDAEAPVLVGQSGWSYSKVLHHI